MSQTKNIKSAALKVQEKNTLQMRAKLCGIMRSAGSLELSRSGISFSIATENDELASRAAHLIRQLYRVETQVVMEESNLRRHIYNVSVCGRAEDILKDLGVLSAEGEICYDYQSGDFQDKNFVVGFLLGMFLGSGSVYLPSEEKSGYHLEFVVSSEIVAENLCHLLAEFDFMPKKVARRGSFVVYLKEREAIGNFFALVGVSTVVFELSNIVIEREARNLANRQANCIAANIDKTVNASQRQLEAIRTIESVIGLNELPEKLKELCEFRLQYPDETLAELCEKMQGNPTKSAINHRFRKIISIANELGGSHNDL